MSQEGIPLTPLLYIGAIKVFRSLFSGKRMIQALGLFANTNFSQNENGLEGLTSSHIGF